MEQTTTTTVSPTKKPALLFIISIFSYIGSSIWALFSLIFMILSSWVMSFLGIGMSAASQNAEVMEGLTDEQKQIFEHASETTNGIANMGTAALIGIGLVSLILAILSLIGIVKMGQLKKSGFWMYAIVNIIVLITTIYAGWWVTSVVSAAFIIMYSLNLKHMK